MKIQLLLTGNEIMSGHTVDSNSAMIAELLAPAGYSIHRKVTIGDDFDELTAEIDHLSTNSDIVIVNGGLGPTIDDLTAEALAKVMDVPITEHAGSKQHIEQWCQQRGILLNQANMKQAMLPEGVEIIANPVGSAVGFYATHNDCLIICTPGVPSELRGMLKGSIVDLLCELKPSPDEVSTIRLQTFGIGESSLQQRVISEYPDWPQEVELGFRAGIPQLEIKLTVRNTKHLDLQKQCYKRLRWLFGDYIIGEDSTLMAEKVIELLAEQNCQLTTAESCTGGLIASMITEIPGSSKAFGAGFVSYANDIKERVLGVDKQLLEEYGAVSEPVVRAMAEGAAYHSKADYVIAVSGIAGPDGGTAEKPVGTVWIAWGHRSNIKTQHMRYKVPRKWFQQLVAAAGLDLIRRELLGITEMPSYFAERR